MAAVKAIWQRRPWRGRPLFRGYHVAFATVLALVVLQIAAAYVIGRQAFGIAFDEVFTFGTSYQTLAGWLLLPLLIIGLVTLKITLRRSERPTRLLLRWIRLRSDWLIRGFLIISAYPTMGKAFTIIKSAIPNMVGFWADPMLVEWDRALLGADAWIVAHQLFSIPVLIAIDRVYFLWFTYFALLTGVFSFTRDIRFQARSALTFFLCWILLGNFTAYALPSVGPIFYDQVHHSDHFRGLTDMLGQVHRDPGLVAMHTVDFLLTKVGKPKLGMGISAMPSMHVSIAWLGILMATHYRGKVWLKVFTLAFTTATVIGSVYLGWHYLVDGVVSIIGTTAIWFFARWFVDRTYRPSRSPVIAIRD
ncbi:phosphatase PAP2 family protein [Tsuneonella sp. HG094]